jgi:hypothetical protein
MSIMMRDSDLEQIYGSRRYQYMAQVIDECFDFANEIEKRISLLDAEDEDTAQIFEELYSKLKQIAKTNK